MPSPCCSRLALDIVGSSTSIAKSASPRQSAQNFFTTWRIEASSFAPRPERTFLTSNLDSCLPTRWTCRSTLTMTQPKCLAFPCILVVVESTYSSAKQKKLDMSWGCVSAMSSFGMMEHTQKSSREKEPKRGDITFTPCRLGMVATPCSIDSQKSFLCNF